MTVANITSPFGIAPSSSKKLQWFGLALMIICFCFLFAEVLHISIPGAPRSFADLASQYIISTDVEAPEPLGNGSNRGGERGRDDTGGIGRTAGNTKEDPSSHEKYQKSAGKPKTDRSFKNLGSKCVTKKPSSLSLHPPLPESPLFLKEYVQWHAKQRRCLSDPSCPQKPRVLVSRCPIRGTCLGLGDRMRGVQFGFWLAIVTKRVFFLEWPKIPFEVSVAMTAAAVDWTLPSTINFNDSWPLINLGPKSYPLPENFTLGLSGDLQEAGQIGPISFKDDDIGEPLHPYQFISVYSRASHQLPGFFGKNPYYGDLYTEHTKTIPVLRRTQSLLLKTLFRPSEATQLKMRNAQYPNGQPYLSMHVRTGVDFSEDHGERFQYIATHGDLMARRMVRCLVSLRKSIGGPSRVFLAADSSGMKTRVRKVLERNGFEVRQLEDKAVHVAKTNERHIGNMSESQLCESYVAVFADLFMLAGGEIILGNGSNFLMMAKMFNDGGGIKIYHEYDDIATLCKSDYRV